MDAHSVAFGEERLNHMARAAQHVLQQANISSAGAHVVQRFSARTAPRKPWSRSEAPLLIADATPKRVTLHKRYRARSNVLTMVSNRRVTLARSKIAMPPGE